MRDIKFRAWDSLAEVWVENMKEQPLWFVLQPASYINIMQYTGLRDKNGKEIHEGDVVKIQHYHDRRKHINGFIKFEDGAFLIDVSDMETYISNEIQDIEVIGNIYENPELLN